MSYFSNPEPTMTEESVNQIIQLIQVGDALFSYEKMRLTNWLIKGDMDHASIVSIYNNRLFVVEAIKPVVIKTPLVEWLYRKDHVAVGRLKGKNAEFREACGAWALTQLGDKYDTMFRKFRRNSKSNKTYCSKLVANALRIFFTGELEPMELMENKKIHIIYNTRTSKI